MAYQLFYVDHLGNHLRILSPIAHKGDRAIADFSAIRDGLKERLVSITGLRGYDTAPGTIEPPCAVVAPAPGAFIVPTSLGRGSFDVRFAVYLLVSSAWNRTAQDALDAYLATEGNQSVWVAIEDTPVTGTQYAVITGISNYGQIVYAGIQYYGVRIGVTVGAI